MIKKRKRSPAELAAIKRYYAQRNNVPQQRVEAPYPHFRYYRVSRHPALIVGEQISDSNKPEYRYRKVMHSDKDGRHNNERVFPNPDPRDKEPMYIGTRVRHDSKEKFEPKPLPWIYKKGKKK